MHELPGSLRLTSVVPVRRPLGASSRALRALMPRAEGEGRRVVLLGGEPGLGQEPPRARVRARGGRRRRARPLRRLRRGRAHALRAVRRGARPARARRRPRRAARGARHRGRRAHAPAARSARPRRRAAAAGRGRPRHRAPPAAHGGDRPARRRQPRRPVLLVLEDGHWADAPTLLLLRHLARAAGDARVLLLATFRDTEADVPEALVGDARRPAPLRRRRAAAARRPLRATRSREFVRRAAGGDAGAELAGARAGDRRAHRAATRSSSASSGARSSRPARSRSSDGTIRLTRPLARARHARERARGRQPAARAAGARDDRPARARGRRRAGVRARRRAAAPRASASRELLAALDEAVRSGMIEELPSRRARLPLHARARAPRALRPAVRRCGARSCTCASARRSRRADEPLGPRRSPTSRTTSRAAAPLGEPRAGDRVQRARRPRGRRPRSRSTRRRRGCAPRSSCGIDEPGRRAPRCCLELGTAQPPRGRRRSTRWRRSAAAADIARELGDARAARARRDRLRGRVLAPGHRRPGRGRAARGGGRRARRGRLASCASGCSAGSRARSTSRATTSAARSCATNAIAMARAARRPRRARHRARCAPTGRAGTSSLEEILEMLDRGARPRRGARRHRDPRRGDGVAGARARRARRPRVGAARGRRAARRLAEQTRAAVHAPRRRALRLGDRALRRAPRRGRGSGAALARVEPAADRARRLRRLRDPDVQHPPRAGAAGRARAGDPDPRRRASRGGAVAARASSPLLAELGMEDEARRELDARRRRRARRASASRSGSPRSPTWPTRARRSATRPTRGARLPASSSRSRGRT